MTKFIRAAALLALGVLAAPAAAQAPSEPQFVPGGEGFRLFGVSCGSSTECVAVSGGKINAGGDYVGPSKVFRVSGGRIYPAANSSTTGDGFGSVSCPTAHDCVAVGAMGMVASIHDGLPGPSRPVPGFDGKGILRSVSCWTASDCVAVGDMGESLTSVVVSIKDGVPQPPVTTPGAAHLIAVACGSSTCQAIGSQPYGPNPDGTYPPPPAPGTGGIVMPITNGTPGAPVVVQGHLIAIDCPSATTCLASGSNLQYRAIVMSLTNGTPGAQTELADGVGIITLACESVTQCIGLTFAKQGFGVRAITNGVPGPAQSYPGGNYGHIACASGGGCLGVGVRDAAAGHPEGASIVGIGIDIGGGAGADVTTPPKATGAAVSVGVGCAAGTGKSCAVKGLLTSRVNGRSVVVGTKNVTIKSDGRSTVKVTLNAKGKSLYARSHRLAVTLTVTSTTSGKTTTVTTRKLTLKQ